MTVCAGRTMSLSVHLRVKGPSELAAVPHLPVLAPLADQAVASGPWQVRAGFQVAPNLY